MTNKSIYIYIVGIPFSRCNNPGGDCCRVRGYWKHARNGKHAQEKMMQNMEKTIEIDGTQPAPVDMQYIHIYIYIRIIISQRARQISEPSTVACVS